MSVKNKEGSAAGSLPQDDGEVIDVRVVKTEQPVTITAEPEVLKVVEPEVARPVAVTEAVEPVADARLVVDAPGRPKARKTARNIAISAFLMLILLAGAGVAYTYFFGPSASEVVTAKAVAEVQPLPKPAVPADNAPEGVAIGAFTTPVKPSDNASIQVHTQPTSTCTIVVTYNSVAAADSGLVGKTADDYGSVGWSWTVPAATPEGKWPVKVTCTYHGRSGVYQAELEVSKAA